MNLEQILVGHATFNLAVKGPFQLEAAKREQGR